MAPASISLGTTILLFESLKGDLPHYSLLLLVASRLVVVEELRRLHQIQYGHLAVAPVAERNTDNTGPHSFDTHRKRRMDLDRHSTVLVELHSQCQMFLSY